MPAKNLDPSRTTMLRRQWMADLHKRLQKLRGDVTRWLVDDDMLGLKPTPHPFRLNVRQYEFLSNPDKVEEFKKWFQGQVDAGVLQTSKQPPWTDTYVDSAYRKGVVRAYTDTHKETLAKSVDFYKGGQAQFLQDTFAAPETVSKLKMLYTRAYDGLKGFTDEMSAQTSRILTSGVANGWHPSKIARELNRTMSGLERKRAMTIARTEVIHAHAEGQLDSFQRMGIKEVKIQAEWLTAGDDRVCSRCGDKEGEVMPVEEARGQIPLHPNCRCAWSPVVSTDTAAGEKLLDELGIKVPDFGGMGETIERYGYEVSMASEKVNKALLDLQQARATGSADTIELAERALRRAERGLSTAQKRLAQARDAAGPPATPAVSPAPPAPLPKTPSAPTEPVRVPMSSEPPPAKPTSSVIEKAIEEGDKEYKGALRKLTTPTKAEAPLEWLDTVLPGDALDQEKLQAVKKAIEEGTKMNPLVAREIEGKLTVVDGHHRYYAYKQLYGKDYVVDVVVDEKSYYKFLADMPIPKAVSTLPSEEVLLKMSNKVMTETMLQEGVAEDKIIKLFLKKYEGKGRTESWIRGQAKAYMSEAKKSIGTPGSAPSVDMGKFSQIRGSKLEKDLLAKRKAALISDDPEGFERFMRVRTKFDKYEDLVEEANKVVRARAETASIYVRTPADAFDDFILKDGKWKSQFETRTSGGSTELAYRKNIETKVVGLKSSTPPADRPIYGQLLDLGDTPLTREMSSQYGSLSVRLKDEVKDRATMTVGDSFQGVRERMAASPVKDPSVVSAPMDPDVLNKIVMNPTIRGSNVEYWETQIHGGVRVSDIAEVWYDKASISPSRLRSLKGKLKPLGIEIRPMPR